MLKNLAIEKLKKEVEKCSSAEEVADAAIPPYDASTVAEEIRDGIVVIAVTDQNIGVDPNKTTDLEDVMMAYPELAMAIAKAATVFTRYISKDQTLHCCPNALTGKTGCEWHRDHKSL